MTFLGGAEIQVNVLERSNAWEKFQDVLKKKSFEHAEVTAYGNVAARKDNSESFIIRIQREKGKMKKRNYK